jgi:hypothetical protein
MTVQRARKLLWTMIAAFAVFLMGLMALAIYGLAHPGRHPALLVLIATVTLPALITVFLVKTGFGRLSRQNSPIGGTSIKAVLRRNPIILILIPSIIAVAFWIPLLVAVGMRAGGNMKDWSKSHTVFIILWTMTPQVLTAYLLVSLHATYTGIYLAACIVYVTVTTAVGGLSLENGVVKFFGAYKAQASPIVFLTLALLCAMSFGVLHFAVWSMWPSEYANLHGIEDAMYFSVVTMATVGYGDILPVGHAARWLCVSEILSGVLLLVVGVSASMTIWLQTNQPPAGTSSQNAPTERTDGESQPPETV